jgi:WXG100 family type VII secretion target
MSKANVDPAELRRFAQDLGRFSSELEGLMQSIYAKARGLEASWRDQEQRKFFETFDQTAKQVGRFLDESKEHVKFLAKKASAVEEYLKQR